MHGDAAGHDGYLQPDRGTLELYRDGTLVEPTDEYGGYWVVPPAPATYRLVVRLGGTAAVSTEVAGEWTFRSGHVAGDEPVALPVAAVRFAPRLAPDQTAPAGVPFAVPVSVQGQAGAGRTGRPVVRVSYDEGRSWAAAPVVRGQVRLRHPAGAGSVSLRATVTDRAGNRVDQTILRAYLLR